MNSLRALSCLITVLFLVGLACVDSASAQPLAAKLSTYDTYFSAQSTIVVQSGDLNLDGIPDVVFGTANDVQWAAGDGLGGFLAPQVVVGLAGTQFLTLADMDGDADLDVLLMQTNGDTHWVENDLPNGFGAAVFVGPGSGEAPRGVVAGDVTGNGLRDVVAAFVQDAFLFPQTSAGTFGPPQPYSSPAPPIFGVAVGAIGGNATDDVLLTSPNQALVFLDGNLNAPISSSIIGHWGPTLADFDNDGCLDLVTTNLAGAGTSGLSLGDCTGAFISPTPLMSNPHGVTSLAATSDENGFLDVVTLPGLSASSLRVHRRDGLGFTGEVLEHLVPSTLRSGAAADLGGDGLDELLLPATAGVIVLRPRSTGEYRAPRPLGETPSRTSVLADLNGDGLSELISAGGDGFFSVEIRAGLGNGAFGPSALYDGGFSVPTDLAVLDLNQDGRVDIVVGRNGPNLLYLYQTPAGTFGSPVLSTFFCSPTQVLAADVTGDGNADLLVGCTDSNEVRLLDPSGATTSLVTSVQSLVATRVGDLDGDGLLDVVVADATNAQAGQVNVLRSLGGGQFQALPGVTAIPGNLRGLALADVNGDGLVDLVTGTALGEIRWYPGSGGGLFGPAAGATHAPVVVGGLAAGDLNGDGLADVVVSDLGTSSVASLQTLLSTGSGALDPATQHPVPRRILQLRLSDVDGDGALDVLYSDSVAVGFVRNETLDPPSDRRGDCNDDGSFGLPDAIAALQFLFQFGSVVCEDACDVDDSGTLNLLDPILLLQYLFQGGAPPNGVSGCRPDLTPDGLAPCPGSIGCPTP